MSDLTPNDLSHLSDAEHNALAPQGYHAPGPATALSPAAQAILDAIQDVLDATAEVTPRTGSVAAAAIRAAAMYCRRDTLQLISIADELEGVGTNTIQED